MWRQDTRHSVPSYGEPLIIDLSKCFLGNRDNFCPYEQAFNNMEID